MKKLILFFLLSFAAYSTGFSQCRSCPDTSKYKFNFITYCDTCICGHSIDTLIVYDTVAIPTKDTFAVYTLNTTVNSATWSSSIFEHQLYSFLIPANTLNMGDRISIWYKFTKSGTAGICRARIKFGTNNNLSDATVAFYLSNSGAQDYIMERQWFMIKTDTTLIVYSQTSSNLTDISGGQSSIIPINIHVNNYIGFTGELGNGSDIFIFDASSALLIPHKP